MKKTNTNKVSDVNKDSIYDKNVKSNYKNEYENFYAAMNKKKDKKIDEEKIKKEKNKKKIVMISLSILSLFIIIFLIIKLFPNNKNEQDINLLVNTLELKEGESKYISYEIVNYQNAIKIIFISDNESIAKVDENGNVLGVSEGTTKIKLKYESNNSNKEKECNIIVTKGENPNKDASPSLNVLFEDDNKWINHDAIVKIDAESNSGGKVTTKYSINCDDNCHYVNISNNEISINNNGINKVKIIAVDTNGKEVSKEITVKIDKINPVLTLENNGTIEADHEVEVCAICYDYDSGCNIQNKDNKVCRKYNVSSSNQVLTIEDNAGNIGTSSTFDVIIK